MANPQIIVDFTANTAGLQAGLNQASGSTKGFGSSLKSMGKAGALAAGAAGVGALVAVTKIGIDEFSQAAKVTAQTEAAIKSTGGAAGVTASQVTDLAGALMKKSGVDDEAIQSGENLLLTFTNIQNKAGEGNDIFNQTTKTMLDMSVALGQDTTQSAMQLGKALNDPIKGMTALRRVGVSFTDAQKEQVKAMVAAGDTMGAQKLILAELNKEFGGSAEALGKTLPGQISILKESFNNFAGDLVAKVIPYVQQLFTFMQSNWPAISAAISGGFEAAKPTLEALGQTIKALGDVVVEVVKVIKDNWGTIGPIVTTALAVVKAQIDFITGVLRVFAALLRGDWSAAWEALKQTVTAVIDNIVARVKLVLLPLQALLTGLWNGIKLAAQTAWTGIQTLITTVMNTIKANLTAAWNAITTAVTTALNSTKTAVTTAWNAIKAVVQAVVGPITSAVQSVARAFAIPAAAAQTMLSGIRSAFNAVAGAINAVVGAVGRAAQKVADAIMAPINAAKAVVNAVLSRFNALRIPGFEVHIGMPGPVPDINFGWGGYDLPDIPLLAKGGVVSSPTLAMVGEGQGREIIAPESLLRSIVASQTPEVRVFIGDLELRDLVRVEIVRSDERLARTLLAGATV